MNNNYTSPTAYEGAPELLMNAIHEAEALLAQSKIKSGSTESWKFWKNKADVMKFAWDYMRSLKWVIKENYNLKQQVAWLQDWNAELMVRNHSYENVRLLITMDKLDEVVQRVNKEMEKDLATKMEKEANE